MVKSITNLPIEIINNILNILDKSELDKLYDIHFFKKIIHYNEKIKNIIYKLFCIKQIIFDNTKEEVLKCQLFNDYYEIKRYSKNIFIEFLYKIINERYKNINILNYEKCKKTYSIDIEYILKYFKEEIENKYRYQLIYEINEKNDYYSIYIYEFNYTITYVLTNDIVIEKTN